MSARSVKGSSQSGCTVGEMAEFEGQHRGSISPLVAEVISEAIDRAGKALALARRIQPLLGRTYADRTVSAWGRGDVMPPADAVFAAAQATGVSLDERLGIGREPTALERQFAELQEQFDDQRRVSAAMERRLEELAARLGDAAASSPHYDAEAAGDLSKTEAALIQLEVDLTHLGSLLGRRWDDRARPAPSDASMTERVMRRIGRIEARIAEVGVPAPPGGYPPRPESADEDAVRRWAAEELSILQQQLQSVQERVRRFGASPDAASQAQ